MAEAIATDTIARIDPLAPRGMITLRGDLADKTFVKTVEAVAGTRVPKPLGAALKGEAGLLWMSPDELMLLCPYDDVSARLTDLNAKLTGLHAMAVDVSDARAAFAVSGDAAREVLAKLTPTDMSPDAFTKGIVRRTRLAQVPAALWLAEDGAFHVVCFRSVADYVAEILTLAAQPGSAVGVF